MSVTGSFCPENWIPSQSTSQTELRNYHGASVLIFSLLLNKDILYSAGSPYLVLKIKEFSIYLKYITFTLLLCTLENEYLTLLY